MNNTSAKFHITRAIELLTDAHTQAEECGLPLLAKLTATTSDTLADMAQQLNALAALARREIYPQEA